MITGAAPVMLIVSRMKTWSNTHEGRSRFLKSLLFSVPFVASGYLVLHRSWRAAATLAFAFCFLAAYESSFHRLSRRSRVLVVASLFVGMVAAILLFA